MLYSLMYHHINGDKFSNKIDVFEKHLEYLTANFAIVTPEDTLPRDKDALCITFDDAYYDFYHFVFPLLKKYNIKAVLAVPTGLIAEETTATIAERLSLGHQEIYVDKNYQKFGSFCTWSELKEMQESGLVVMASHSHKHKDLASEGIDLNEEIVGSKKILEEKLNTTIDSFILPFGRYNYDSVTLLKQHYQYIFKVGQGVNRDFRGVKNLIYRIDADNITNIEILFSFKNILKYKIKSLIKSIYDGIQK